MANQIPVKAILSEGAAVALGEFESTDTIAGDRVDVATEEAVGVVELAADEESAAGKVVQSNDARLSDARTPSAHASTHQHNGGDEVATATPAANAIPKAGAGGDLDAGWLPAATEAAAGAVQLAEDMATGSGLAVQADDARLSDARTPSAHASTHQHNGGDEVATATPAANAIPKAGAGGDLDAGWLPAATDEAAGAVELATEEEVYTGTDTGKAITPAGLAGSYNFGRKVAEIHIVPDDTDVDTTSGVAYLKIPQALHLMKLVRAQAFVHTAGTTGATTIQVRNLTAFPSDDALSSAVSIASGDTVGTAAAGDGTHNQVATNANLKIYVTAQSTTKPQGLYVILEFEI